MSSSLSAFAREKLAALDQRGQRRRVIETGRDGIHMTRADGKPLISFCCNDYLNLSAHLAVKEAAARAAHDHGAGAGASRLITGSHPLLHQLEQELAALKGTEDAVVFGSGYLANLGIIPVFAGEGDLILVDELAHACLNAGAKISDARVIRFRHNDMDDLERQLVRERSAYRHCLVLTDGVFSMDGDLAPLPALAEIAARFDAWLMSDDAHGVGVLARGRGSRAHFAPPPDVPLQMGTLSKALGSYGGYLCADHEVCELVRNRARSFVYSTGLPPAAAGAALAALEIIKTSPDICAKPLALARSFASQLGLTEAQSPIVPIVLGSEDVALDASRIIEDAGFLVTAIRPPTVPAGTSRLRVTFTAGHSEMQVDRLAQLIRKLIISVAAE